MRFGAILRKHPVAAVGILPVMAALCVGSASAIAGTAKCESKYSTDTKMVTVHCVHQGTGPAQCQLTAKLTCEGSGDFNWFYGFALQPGRTRDLEKDKCVGGQTITSIASWKVECE